MNINNDNINDNAQTNNAQTNNVQTDNAQTNNIKNAEYMTIENLKELIEIYKDYVKKTHKF